jgi:hypothetical protein
MKYLYLFLFLILGYNTNAQVSDSLINERSKRMSKMMFDSLQLNDDEYGKIQSINYNILKTKATLMQSEGDRIMIQKDIQRVENGRDSLYQKVLPIEKFNTYRRLKEYFLSNS